MAAAALAAVPAGAAGQVALDLTGEVELLCTIEKVGIESETIALEPTGDGSVKLPLTVDCNVPFSYTLESENGGFRNAEAETFESADGITLLPYDVTVTIDGLQAAGLAPATTTSEEMSVDNGGFTASSAGVVVFESEGEMLVEWNTTGLNLFAGDYVDTITITIDGDVGAAVPSG